MEATKSWEKMVLNPLSHPTLPESACRQPGKRRYVCLQCSADVASYLSAVVDIGK